MNPVKYFFTIVVALILGAIIATYNGYYPVALVNYSPVFEKDFQTMSNATVKFYNGAITRYQKKELNSDDAQKLVEESGRAVLDRLIEMTLIHNEIKNRIGGELQQEIDKRVANIEEKSVTTGVNALYGFTFEQFKQFIAAPEIEKELLAGSLKKDGQDFSDWIKTTRQTADVLVLLPNVEWKDDVVKLIK